MFACVRIPHLFRKKYISNTKSFCQHDRGLDGAQEQMGKNVLCRNYHASRPQIRLLFRDIYLILRKYEQIIITKIF